jgi:hypothetical protein
MARKTRTPKGLSILRKLWTYIGNGGIMATYFGEAISDHRMVQIMIIYNIIGFAIQTICDTYFVQEKPENFKPEKN